MKSREHLKKITGDASFRTFFRKKNKTNSSIIVYAKKEKFQNLLVYDAINKILIKNKILAPILYKENYKKNNIEIQDFGNNTIYKILKKKKVNKFRFFKRILEVLNQIQSIKDNKVLNFKRGKYFIPKYDSKILVREAHLFCDWYVKEKLPNNMQKKFNYKFKKIVRKLSSNLKLKNRVFVHRDFHVSNLMLFNKQIAVIDSQDAHFGNKAYDLASLIDDVRFKTSTQFKNRIYKMYINNQSLLEKKNFKNDFEILSVLRNLKIIGIFTRLAVRDKKRNYLKLIPYAWKLIENRIYRNKQFEELNILLKKNFKMN